MSRAFTVELYKTRKRHIWIPVLSILAVQILWAFWSISRWKEGDYSKGWMYLLYQFPLLNCIMMPVVISMVASRLSDIEHKGSALRMLCTMQTPGRLFDFKFLRGGVYVLLVALLQTVLITAMGLIFSFGAVPWGQLALFFLSGLAVGLTLYLLQQTLSLLFQNQLIPMIIGLAGSFIGLMTMFFPTAVQKLVLWAYYGLLSTTAMDWNQETRITRFEWVAFDWSSLALLLCAFVILYLVGRTLFAKKER